MVGDSGAGSLRAVVSSAPAGSQISFSPSLNGQTIKLTTGQIALNKNLTIQGPGASLLAISGSCSSRIFDVIDSAHVAVNGLTFKAGLSSHGGAICNEDDSSLMLVNDVFSGNEAVGDINGDALGGAIYNSAGSILNIDHGSFLNNLTNGANESFGGAIDNVGGLTITSSSFSGNQAIGSQVAYGSPGGSMGGAIENEDGATLTVQQTSFAGNQALGSGNGDALAGAISDGSIYLFPFTGIGITTVVANCTFTNNTATGGSSAIDGGFGGAIEDLPGSNLTVSNSTFSGNQANVGGGSFTSGGAIDGSPGDIVTINNSTFLHNSVIAIPGPGVQALGGAVDNFAAMTITNSTFVGNLALAGPGGDDNFAGEAQGGAVLNESPGVGFPIATMTLNNCTFNTNAAIGGSNAQTGIFYRAGSGRGGAIENFSGQLTLTSCTITNNLALGGAQSVGGPGSIGWGGGIDNNDVATMTVTNTTISGNVAQGGSGGAGFNGGPGSGGGIANDRISSAVITNCIISGNKALGGSGGAGATGGLGLGGGISTGDDPAVGGPADPSILTVAIGALSSNLAQGGSGGTGANGGNGLGGGVFVGDGRASFNSGSIFVNTALGGQAGSGAAAGLGVGGGIFISLTANVTITPRFRVINNHASTSNDDIFGPFGP